MNAAVPKYEEEADYLERNSTFGNFTVSMYKPNVPNKKKTVFFIWIVKRRANNS